jgi:tripartite-type tricarboxylate transporter receptor subunit TctC
MKRSSKYLSALFLAAFALSLLVGWNSVASASQELAFEKWPAEKKVIAGIDAVIKDLNNGNLNEKEAVAKITEVIPKPIGYPKRPITIVIGWGPGGGSDRAIRSMGREAEKFMDVPLVYVNMPGASSEVSTAYVYKQAPDGYTLLSVNGSPPANALFMDLPYSFVKEFSPIFSGQGYSEAFFVSKDSPFKKWDDLVAWAKKNPGKLTIATVGKTTDDQFVLWKVAEHFGITIVNMGFESSGERRSAVIGGHVVALADSVGTVSQLLKNGDLRPILYYGPVRFTEIDPDVPCMGDYGLKVKTLRWRGIAGPPKLPKEIQQYLYYVFYASHQMPEYKVYEKQSMLHYSQPWALGPTALKKFWTDFYNDGKALAKKYNK